MLNIEKIDGELYKSVYIDRIPYGRNEIWKNIKSSPETLRDAIKVVRNKWDSADTVRGLTICDAMLVDYSMVDPIAYSELIKQIYNNIDIARTVVDGAVNGGYSFLLMSLFNQKLRLSKEQKDFAVSEAMNQMGTTKYKKEKDEYSKKLEQSGITDDITSYVEIDGMINPIGAKSKCEYINDMLLSLSSTQAHGIGAFDIRYNILKNSNWSIEEKSKFVYDFWYDDEIYEAYLDDWEWYIINNFVSDDVDDSFLDICFLYDYTYDELLEFYKNEEVANEVYKEIAFCKLMHKLRPQNWEKDIDQVKELKLQK